MVAGIVTNCCTRGVREGLSGQDRNLTTALVLGVLRWQIALDARLRPLLERPDQPMSDEVWLTLRLGAFQLLHMDRIPAHAALNESVTMCRAVGQEHASGMVNAVLRRLTREPAKSRKLIESTAAFAERLGHPAWMAERWVTEYGRAAALAICETDQREPSRGEVFAENTNSLPDSGGIGGKDAGDAELSGLPGRGTALPVMDDGSRLVAELTAAAAPPTRGGLLRVWDCCAAPGGKTMVLARRLGTRADILATDVSERRLQCMEGRIGELAASEGEGGAVRCLVAQAQALPAAEGMFDLVLCDVPCSGTGTLRRNPEIKHRLTVDELARHAQRQRAILAAGLERVAEGGRLVYSTCSLEREECEAVVAAVASGWRQVPVHDLMRSLETEGVLRKGINWQRMVRRGHLRTLPGVQECDGFYAVILERDSRPWRPLQERVEQ